MVEDPQLTPSARLLSDIQSSGKSFLQWTIDHSDVFHQQLLADKLPAEVQSEFTEQAKHSIALQAQAEQEDSETFKDFLAFYFEQYAKLET